MLFVIAGWLFFSVAAGMFAQKRRNRDGGGWFFIALIFSPLVAFVLLAILEIAPPRVQLVDTRTPEQRRACLRQ